MRRIAMCLAALFLVSPAVSLAEPQIPGKDEAVAVCQSLTFSSDQTRCLELIRGKAFDAKAVAVCTTFTFASDKLKCLEVVADRYFLSRREVDMCAGQTFDSDKLKCLGNCDTQPITLNPEPDLTSIRRSVHQALRALRRNDYRETRYILEDLLEELER